MMAVFFRSSSSYWKKGELEGWLQMASICQVSYEPRKMGEKSSSILSAAALKPLQRVVDAEAAAKEMNRMKEEMFLDRDFFFGFPSLLVLLLRLMVGRNTAACGADSCTHVCLYRRSIKELIKFQAHPSRGKKADEDDDVD